MSEKRHCAVIGCPAAVSTNGALCRPHWFMLPLRIRSAVWRAWDNGHGAGTPQHRAAMRAAILAADRQAEARRDQ